MRRFTVIWAAVLATALVGAWSTASFATAGGAPLVFDLATAVDHDANILWNLKGDNIVHTSVSESWYSSYLTEGGTTSGRVTVDGAAGTVTGTITEGWSCGDDCAGWTYRDATLVATIVNGRISEDIVSGSVSIEYDVRAGRDETPSTCDGAECYICEHEFCTLAADTTKTAELTGSLQGTELSLAFVDELLEDANNMDFSGLLKTEFVMSRFSATVAGPLSEPTGTTEATTTTEAAIPAVGVPVPGVDAGSPPGPDDFENGDAADTASSAGDSSGQAQASELEFTSRGAGLLTILMLLLIGVAGAVIVGWLVRVRMGWANKEAAIDTAASLGVTVEPERDRGFLDELGDATHQLNDQTRSSPAPPPDPPPPPPPDPALPPPPSRSDQGETFHMTPSEYHGQQPGLKPGTYRSIDFENEVTLWQPGSGKNVETITTQFQGPTLAGEPDPAFPGHTPVYDGEGTRIGWVRTEDIPG